MGVAWGQKCVIFVRDYALYTMNNKTRLLATAMRLFSAQGYDRTPTNQIAKEAGVSEGLIFRHFQTRSGLLGAILTEGMDKIATTMRPYTDMATSPREAIVQHIVGSLAAIQEQQDFWRLANSLRFQQSVHEVAEKQITAVNTFVIATLTDNFRKLGAAAPEQEALVLFALIDGICLQWLQAPTQYPLTAVQEHLIHHYRHGNFPLGR